MAVIASRSSDLSDPLQGYSVLSMFPRTFKDAANGNDSDDLESVHNYMKSMVLRSPNKLFEKANGIVHGGSELLNSELASLAASENNNEAAAMAMGNPLERRPALGHKRVQFSLKPDNSRPSVSLEPSLDIGQLQDPEQFFSAYQKLEYAREEIQRQTHGNTTGKNVYNPSANLRRRRPGILGKSVSYRHHYSSVVSENDGTRMSSQETSQETLQQDSLSPNFDSQQETANHVGESQENELAGSISNTENRVNKLLDELLSRNIENLDGDGALSLLQERLRIKPVDVDRYLPKFSDIGRADFMDLGEELPTGEKPQLDIQNVKRLSGKTPVVTCKFAAENPGHSLASPTPPKSPFAALTLLKKRISQSNPIIDPFSALDIDLSPPRSPFSLEHINRQSDQLDKLKSPVQNEDTNGRVASVGSKKVMKGDSDSVTTFDKSVSVNKSSIDIDIRSSGSHGNLVDQNESNHMDGSARPNAGHNMGTDGANKMAENAGDILQEVVSSAEQDTVLWTHGLSETEENVEDMQLDTASLPQPDVNIDGSTNNLNNSQSQGQSDHTVSEDHLMDGHPTTAKNCPEQQNKEHLKSPLKIRSKGSKPHERRERKALSRRQSLSAAGTYWESGVRRSKRIKMRPLEYWKGERFLYGRVHESLTTVIGVKCISSPGMGGEQPKFRVKSYVTDEHKDLVELAALH